MLLGLLAQSSPNCEEKSYIGYCENDVVPTSKDLKLKFFVIKYLHNMFDDTQKSNTASRGACEETLAIQQAQLNDFRMKLYTSTHV